MIMAEPISAVAKKLLIKSGKHWLFLNAPDNYLALLEPLPAGTITFFEYTDRADGIQFFVKNSDELADSLASLKLLLKTDTIIWVSYPKKSSGIKTDLEMTGSWDEAAKYGLGVVASISIDQTWTALRLRQLTETRLSGTSNNSIKQNDYSDYIDPDKKILTLPADLQSALENSPSALAYFTKLSYANRKEYLLWVLTAKQEKTRIERIDKTIEKLLAGKKNPSEK